VYVGLIAHRGNLWGPNPERENDPNYVNEVLNAPGDFDAEVDLWADCGGLWLGHDGPTYRIPDGWLKDRHARLWVHCKNVQALEYCKIHRDLNYFWHQNDDYTVTSLGYVWVYPGKPVPHCGVKVDKDCRKNCGSAKKFEILCSDWVGEVARDHKNASRGEVHNG